jgi:citronellol/citronellal dehydrogenase
MIPGVDPRKARTPRIMADAAYAILGRESRKCTGNFFIDEDVLKEEGIADLSRYAVEPGQSLLPDIFLD